MLETSFEVTSLFFVMLNLNASWCRRKHCDIFACRAKIILDLLMEKM